MNLTEQEQRTLTEWLGEKFYSTYPLNQKNLNFSDPRVAWRLIEKMKNINIWKHPSWGWIATYTPQHLFHEGETPQEAVICAALSYLEEKP